MPTSARSLPERLTSAIDATVYRLFGQLFGVAIAAIVLITWGYQVITPDHSGSPTAFAAVDDPTVTTPREARDRVASAPTVQEFETHLSEAPVWLYIDGQEETRRQYVFFPSRHATLIQCWQSASLTPLGEGSRTVTVNGLRPVGAGFAIDTGDGTGVVCKIHSRGPARITVKRASAEQLTLVETRFARNAGLLDGGMILLTAFVLTVAIINRQWIYLVFAGWLIANLRLAALSAGWDQLWMGIDLPAAWLPTIRQLTMAAYFVLTYLLFSRLFKTELHRIPSGRPMRFLLWSCPPLVVLALTLQYATFLPIMWLVTTAGVLVVGYLLVRLISVTRSRVAIWYLGSLAVALLANLSEVVSAALGFRENLSSLNSVTAALASSLLAALAIAEQMRQEREHRLRAQADLHATYNAMPIGLFSLDGNGVFCQSNPALRAMLGVHKGAGQTWRSVFGESGWQSLRTALEESPRPELELCRRERNAPGDTWHLVRATRTKGRIEGSVQDITARVAATRQLQFLADHDPLTGILNRRGIETAFDAMSTNGLDIALAYIDLDRFKLINDLFGHVAGDEVLRQVCHRINSHLAPEQRLGRIGGDEFVILCGASQFSNCLSLCRTLMAAIEEAPYQIDDRAFQIRASAGVVEVAAGTGCTDAISLADRACRQAKLSPHGQIIAFEKNAPALSERDQERELLQRLDAPKAPDGLFLLMQPIIALADPYGSLNFEVLLRMRDSHQNVIPAGRLIGAAERSGRISVIDRWVLTEVLRWLSTHRDKIPATRFACMNLSGGSLNDERFIQDAFAILADYPDVASLVCIEITESVALHDLSNTRRFIEGVRKHGARIALDDFGAGYTSFSYLKELPADLLKIDGEFVRGVALHPADLSIVEAIVQLARNLGMRSLAEWAEDRATVEALASVGVDYVQGFAVARPMLPEKLLTGQSAASFIEDPGVERFVREDLLRASRTGMTFMTLPGNPDKLH